MTSLFDICMYACTLYYTGARFAKNIQDLIGHVRNVHDDARRPLPFGRSLPQQPPRCWRRPVHACPALYPRAGCELPRLSQALCLGQSSCFNVGWQLKNITQPVWTQEKNLKLSPSPVALRLAKSSVLPAPLRARFAAREITIKEFQQQLCL